ncbi:TIR domain-containing protein [Rhizobium leguminosarum]|uniref:TIR domain-containing protein n=1 Tax=Rhizobium leguminosarum TaxID=384 RepID=UPI003F967B8B
MINKVFVSHATADVALAKLVVNFLKEAIGVPDANIFCSSLPGHSIPLMEDFNEHIRNQIEQPAIVIALLTPSYLESHFCLMELGAAWSRAHKTLAVVTSTVSFDAVTRTLGLKQAWRIDDHTKLFEFKRAFKDLELESRSSATWEGKAAEWRKRLPTVLRGLPSAKLVEKVKLDTAVAEAEELKRTFHEEGRTAKMQIARLEEDNAALQQKLANKEEGRPRVLIVEPEKLIALDLRQMLERARYDVVGVATTKQDAMIAALIEKPDIVLTETELEDGSSGIDLVNALYPLMDCFAIFVTAYPERLLKEGRPQPVDLVTKPFSPDEVLTKVLGATQFVLQRRTRTEP